MERRCGRDPRCPNPVPKGEKTCVDHIDVDELERAISGPDDEGLEQRVHRLEAASGEERAPATAPREDDVAVKKASTSMRIDPPWKCGCGRFETDWPAARAKHQLHCDGRPIATSGRIAATTDTKAAVPAPSRKRTKKVVERIARGGRRRSRKGVVRVPAAKKSAQTERSAKGRTAAAAITVPIPRVFVVKVVEDALAELRRYRDGIDKAIAAIEALA